MENKWFLAIYDNNIEKVKELIDQGVDINYKNSSGYTPLLIASFYEKIDVVKLLLIQPNINIDLVDNDIHNFIDIIFDKSLLINYKLQKNILNNQREDIIILLNKYNLIHPKIKDEVPELFQVSQWGLI
jgi:ankyrin repeat protein